MQTLLTVIVLLALVAMGALFLIKLNGQQAGRLATHRHPAPPPHRTRPVRRTSHRFWVSKPPQGDDSARPGSHPAQQPPGPQDGR
ncbi:hypothetical protein [Streptomyces sp. NPDC017993]|uniref:hypothetical protein n=1 Tax=Streptomyces sp. NPDC017993 TaxID=3365027 RepID=UPI0037B93CB7